MRWKAAAFRWYGRSCRCIAQVYVDAESFDEACDVAVKRFGEKIAGDFKVHCWADDGHAADQQAVNEFKDKLREDKKSYGSKSKRR